MENKCSGFHLFRRHAWAPMTGSRQGFSEPSALMEQRISSVTVRPAPLTAPLAPLTTASRVRFVARGVRRWPDPGTA